VLAVLAALEADPASWRHGYLIAKGDGGRRHAEAIVPGLRRWLPDHPTTAMPSTTSAACNATSSSSLSKRSTALAIR
jgi:hypothetical protein